MVDATAGNGHDTLKLAGTCRGRWSCHAFDIQQTALDHTKERLAEADFLQRVTLLHLDHSIMDTVIKRKNCCRCVQFRLFARWESSNYYGATENHYRLGT